MRSMSRWKQVRTGQGSTGRIRPLESAARQAKGESIRCSCCSRRSLSVKDFHLPRKSV